MSAVVQKVIVQKHGATAVLTMNSPGNRNALDPEMRAALADAIAGVRDDQDVRSVVLTGVEGCFSSGGDLKGLVRMQQGARDIFEGRSRILEMHRWFDVLVDLEKPVIAAVDGPAFGAGLSLALAADFILATPGSSFCAVFARIGYVPDLSAMYLLPRKVGLTHAKDLVFSARAVGTSEARTLGLVQQEVDGDLLEAALVFAGRFDDAPTEAIGIAKSIMNRTFETSREMIVMQEAAAQALCRESEYHRDAVQRFIDRSPSEASSEGG